MKKYTHHVSILMLVIICVLSLFFIQIPSKEVWVRIQDTIRWTSPAVVLISNQNGVIGAGSIVDVQKGIILTSKHLLKADGQTYTVRTFDGQMYLAQKIIADPIHDLALVQIKWDDVFPKRASLRVVSSQASLERGDAVLSFGALVLNNSFAVSRGIISDTHQKLTENNGRVIDYFIQTDVNAQGGFSGGPLLDEEWTLIGVNTAVFGANTSISWSTPVTKDEIQEMISKF